jgi:RHS repeat-associated protein
MMCCRASSQSTALTLASNHRMPRESCGTVDGSEHYNYFRDYDPSIGRYVESDPIGLKASPDTYGYARGQPLTLADFLGLEPRSICVANAFLTNFRDMVNANVIGADKYFHCKANCEAVRCRKHSYELACLISDTREVTDTFFNFVRRKPNDSDDDQRANAYGRGWGANTQLDCALACMPLRPNGLGTGPYPRPPEPPPLY